MADTSSGSRSIWRLEAPRAGAPPGRARLRAATRGLPPHDLVQSGGRSARPGASAPGDPSGYRPRDLPPTRGPVAARATLRSTTGSGDLTQSQRRGRRCEASSAVAAPVSERGCAGPRPGATRVEGPFVWAGEKFRSENRANGCSCAGDQHADEALAFRGGCRSKPRAARTRSNVRGGRCSPRSVGRSGRGWLPGLPLARGDGELVAVKLGEVVGEHRQAPLGSD